MKTSAHFGSVVRWDFEYRFTNHIAIGAEAQLTSYATGAVYSSSPLPSNYPARFPAGAPAMGSYVRTAVRFSFRAIANNQIIQSRNINAIYEFHHSPDLIYRRTEVAETPVDALVIAAHPTTRELLRRRNCANGKRGQAWGLLECNARRDGVARYARN